MKFHLATSLFVAGFAIAAMTSGLRAEDDHDAEQSGIPVTVGVVDFRATFDAGIGAFDVQNAQFGLGSNSRFGKRAGGRTWYEGFAMPGLEFDLPSEDNGSLYGRVSVIGSITRGQGEASPTSGTSDAPQHLAIEDAFIGWKSGTAFDAWLPSDAIDVSVGNQPFSVGDGFVLVNGTLDGFGRAANYLGPRIAFENTAILRLNTEPVRADIFHIAGGVDQDVMRGNDNPHTKIVGANVEWFKSTHGDHGRFEYEERKWYVGLMALKVYDADRNFSFNGTQNTHAGANRDGLRVLSARFGGSFVPGFDDFALFGEYGIQDNGAGANGGTVDADAWYLQPQYTFSEIPWSPVVSARYAHFSGDSNTNDQVDRSWDPLYTDAGPRGGATWTQGQIYSQYVGANTNLNSWYAGLELAPLDDLKVGLSLFRHRYDEPAQAGARDDHLMDEVDLYAAWDTPIKGLSVTPTVAAGRAGKGQKQAGLAASDDRTIWLGQIVVLYKL
jgi:hypothetical protein